MISWTLERLREATSGRLSGGAPSLPITGLTIDSRRLKPGEAFVAICGLRFDGHDFLPEAVQRGASCLIVSKPPPVPLPVPILHVPDTTQALGELAAFHRAQFAIPVIAVTGSCGKTTTKELIADLLAPTHRVLKTHGTQNNHIGLPLTLLQLAASHQVAVVELGSNHPGEIAYLARIARPTIAVITNVGPAHIGFFGSLRAILQEKLSLVAALGDHGLVIVPGDQLEVLLEAKARRRPGTTLLTFGTSHHCGVQGLDIRRSADGFTMQVRDAAGVFTVPLPGSHNVENALAALACVRALGVPLESIREPLRRFQALPLRSQLLQANGLTILNDCYNANPLSFARALEVLQDLPVRRKVVVVGDMLELGEMAPAAHQAIGRLAAEVGVQLVIGVGQFADDVAKGAVEVDHTQTVTCRTVDDLERVLPSLVQEGDGLLIKGSRKLQLERVAEALLRGGVHAV